MKTPFLVALLAISLSLSACGRVRESRLNPMNWFGGSQEETSAPLGPVSDSVDHRPLVPQINAMTIERTSSGAIVRAEAVMPAAGWWDAELVPENFGRPTNGTLTFRFVAAAPVEPVAETNAAARTLTAVYTLTQAQLDTTAEVVVTGETNSRRARR
ncbi:MAG: hypothetical protein H6899_05800 [Rhodobacter sp.]|nr:hypothetical protein [Paracoccaceae bacterium]MCB1409016.1 hypothetical protein [Paracoccaceae bacterium]MCC0079458.1 hypothetical protein [Rhodobacter sp.]